MALRRENELMPAPTLEESRETFEKPRWLSAVIVYAALTDQPAPEVDLKRASGSSRRDAGHQLSLKARRETKFNSMALCDRVVPVVQAASPTPAAASWRRLAV